MAIKQGREYRALQDFSLVPREENSPEYRVRGTAIVFNTPTVLWECDGVEYKEIIDRHAFDECDMSGSVDNMSFSFTVREAKYDSVTHTRTITKVKKLYDVSAVDIPAYNDTSISARSFFEEEHSRELAALEQARRRKKLVALTY